MSKWVALSDFSQGEQALLSACSPLQSVPTQTAKPGLLAHSMRLLGLNRGNNSSPEHTTKIDYQTYIAEFQALFPVSSLSDTQRTLLLPPQEVMHPSDYAARAFLLSQHRMPLRTSADENVLWQLVKPQYEVLCCVPFTLSFNGTFVEKQQLWPLFNSTYSQPLAGQVLTLIKNKPTTDMRV